MTRAGDRLIVALDVQTLDGALRMARQLRGLVSTVKVGSALFTACGPDAVRRLRALGFGVMLDLKFFDIPNTVALGCRAAARLGCSLLTVHASGGAAMLSAAVRAARDEARRARALSPRILAVTVLTSEAAGAAGTTRRRVVELAATALDAGCDGLVASAQEAAVLRRRFGKKPFLVCPGIRPLSVGRDDQARVATPAQALAAGANALVVGRPVTGAPSPRRAAQDLLTELEGVCRC
jgi:orotidine-5'-phosphate decarboxylase